MDTALGDAWVEHVREAWVWMRERWIPYPFQNNIWRLPNDELIACFAGLIDLQGGHATTAAIVSRLAAARRSAPGICDTFMFPYNRKVWAYDPSRSTSAGWASASRRSISRGSSPTSCSAATT